MRTTRRHLPALAVIGGAVLVCLSGCATPALPQNVTIAGNAETPLQPGRTIPLDLKITNNHTMHIDVSSLRVEIVDIYAPLADRRHPCTFEDYSISQSRQAVTIGVAARSSVWLSSSDLPRDEWPRVEMINTNENQDGCRGASLTLRYTARTMMGMSR